MRVKNYKTTEARMWGWYIAVSLMYDPPGEYYFGNMMEKANMYGLDTFEYMVMIAKRGELYFRGKPVKLIE